MDVVVGESRIRGAREPSADAKHRRHAGYEQQIACAALRDFDQQLLQRIAFADGCRSPRKRGALLAGGSFRVVQLAYESLELRVRSELFHRDASTNEACHQ